jgi:hypothetical protein
MHMVARCDRLATPQNPVPLAPVFRSPRETPLGNSALVAQRRSAFWVVAMSEKTTNLRIGGRHAAWSVLTLPDDHHLVASTVVDDHLELE